MKSIGEVLIDQTKHFNVVSNVTDVDKYMDAVHGFGHRLKHGHSPSDLFHILQSSHLDGGGAVVHYLRDFFSPHGVPVPFAFEIGESLKIGAGSQVKWLTMNAGKVSDISVGIVATMAISEVYNRTNSAWVFLPWVGLVALKLAVGYKTGNAILMATCLLDGVLIFKAVRPRKSNNDHGKFQLQIVFIPRIEITMNEKIQIEGN